MTATAKEFDCLNMEYWVNVDMLDWSSHFNDLNRTTFTFYWIYYDDQKLTIHQDMGQVRR